MRTIPPGRLRRAVTRAVLPALLAVLAACSLVSGYDAHSFETATSLKAEAMVLIDHATENYADHAAACDALVLGMRKAYEYEKGKDKNAETVAQWELMRDPKGHLMGGFVVRWKGDSAQGGRLSPAFVQQAAGEIEGAFDRIIRLEQGKPAE
jgi:hypothetical protein